MDRIYELLAESRTYDARYDLAERRARWGSLREGTGSPVIAMIGRSAGGVRWVSARIEGWASGSGETAGAPQRHVPVR
jgi:hypothetical protein